MSKLRRLSLCLIVVTLPAASGCVTFLGPEDLRWAISRDQRVRLDRDIGMGVDGLTLGLVAAIADVPIPVAGILTAEVGVYTIKGGDEVVDAQSILSNFALRGFEAIVRVREPGNEVVVLAKYNDRTIRSIVVVARDGRELVIVRARGRLEKMLQWALEQGGDGAFLDFDGDEPDDEEPPDAVASLGTALPTDSNGADGEVPLRP